MKDLFPGHFKESEADLREAWDTSLFVFDANILLSLYRYSDTTRNEFLRILEKIKDRAWLPHRAAEEYLSNRLSVIGQQEKSYDDTAKSIELLKKDLENSRQHPFVSIAVMEKVSAVFEELDNELAKNKAVHTTRISNDEIKDAIAEIFSQNVGLPYEKERLEQFIIEGEERYTQKIPPGFKDSSKSGDSEVFSEKCRKYGDLIVWTQVIEKATESGKGIVLVTDDKKEDWWERFKGKTVGPHPELVKEFKERANQTFHMYQADRFLELARENLNEEVSEEIVEEIREVRRRDKIASKRTIEYLNKKNTGPFHLRSKLKSKLNSLEAIQYEIKRHEERKHDTSSQLTMVKQQKDHYMESRDLSNFDSEFIKNQYYKASTEYAEVVEELMEANIERAELQMEIKNIQLEIERAAYDITSQPLESDT